MVTQFNRRSFLKLTSGAVAAAMIPGCSGNRQKPNFVFILVDDLGWKDLGCYGSEFYETPNIDRLAAQGMRFTDAYAACPVCSPTRASIMSGKYPARIHLTDWIKGRQFQVGDEAINKLIPPEFEHQMALEEVTIAESLKKEKYSTCFIGKWHLGEADKFWPEHQGFDINIGGWKKGAPYYRHYDYETDEWTGDSGYVSPYKNPRLEDGPEGEYLTDRLADEAIKYIKDKQQNPFLLYLAFYTVHNPMHGKPEYVAKFKKKAKMMGLDKIDPFNYERAWIEKSGRGRYRERYVQSHAEYAAMVYSLDENVGRVMDTLSELDLEEDTIVIFMSDNGGLSTSEGTPTSNLPLRAGKGWLYDSGIREPMIIKWPGVIQGGQTCSEPVISTDFYPTMLEMAGMRQMPEQHMDGKSMVALLKGDRTFKRGPIFWHYPHYSNQGGKPGAAVRVGDYKLIEWYETNEIELYNMRTDYFERNNLAHKIPDKANELRELLHKWRDRVGADMPTPK